MRSPAELPSTPAASGVFHAVGPVAEAFAAAGHSFYLVGGVVRDLVLGAVSSIDDIDLTTDARPEAIRRLVTPLATAVWAQGERFGTIGATVAGRALEITTHRAEKYDEASRKPVVTFGRSIEEDLSRRDFTVNAMAIELPGGTLLDPHDGRRHLEQRVLRTPLAPEVSFGDDPLRMLRAARFLPRFGLQPDPALRAAATEMADRLQIVSVERVHDELERLLAVPDPTAGLEFLERTGLLGQVLPAYDRASQRIRTDERARALAAAAAPDASPLVRRAGLLAPLGPEARASLRRLRYAGDDVTATMRLLDALPVALAGSVTAPEVRRVVASLGLEHVDDLEMLASQYRSSPLSSLPASSPGSGPAPFFERLAELRVAEDLTDFGIPLSGKRIMALLGVDQGPTVGRAVDHLRQCRMESGPLTVDEAEALLTEWWADRAS